MRILVTALLAISLTGAALAVDRDAMLDNPNAYVQPENWSADLEGDGPVVVVERSTIVYSNLTEFLAIISPGYYFDNFSWADWGVPNAASYFFGPVNGYSYTASASNGLFGIPGAISTNSALDPITIVFDGAPVTAVAGDFFCTDYDGYPVSVNTIITLADGTVVTLAYPTVFAGFVSTVPITSLILDTDSVSNAWMTFDNFYVGEAGTVANEGATLSSVKALFR
ncbi:MAG: hypothetical protein RBT60_14300 [Candidatus Krumholzibacteria bacterium]|jgi:hypothetical protein|nr:hypothetical protein [Candidatus Krumholzibacteria bacterium]